jgi:transposase InsO family protein
MTNNNNKNSYLLLCISAVNSRITTVSCEGASGWLVYVVKGLPTVKIICQLFRNYGCCVPTIGYKNFNETKQAIINYIIDYYNQKKPHRYNGVLSPNESERRYELSYRTVANIT